MSINESSTTTTNNTIVLITGGNTGIGLAIAQALLSAPIEPYSIIVTSRSIERATAAIKGLYNDPTFEDAFSSGSEALPMQLDVDDDESVKAVRQRIGEKFGRVDVLVNNAGVLLDFAVASGAMTTREAFLKSFTTNVISVHTFTETFIDLILKSPRARIVFVTSGIGSLTTHSNPNFPINQSPPAGWPKPYQLNNTTYRTSKTAMNMMALEWKRTSRNDNVKVNLVTPGLSATAVGGTDPDVYRKFGADEPSVGGNFIRTVIEGKRDADEGIGMVMGSGVIPW